MYGQNIQRVEPIILLLLVCVVSLAVLAKRFKTPYPIVLVIAGLVLSLLPRMPHIELNPNVVFLLFLPPLLFSAAAQTSWRDFRYNLVSISMLALGLVSFTVYGVAIASRVGLDNVEVGFDGQPTWSSKPDVAAAAEARALAATCAGVRVWSLYVPNGRALDDPHYTYKLNWLSALRDTASGWLRDDPTAQIALVGDWNIAPTDEDIWSVEFFRGATHVSEPERKAFDAIVDAQFSDVVRPFTPGPGVYTYWDYTQLRFPKKQGMRIDFILGSPAFAGRVADAQIVREERKGKAPSDHAPVFVDLRAD